MTRLTTLLLLVLCSPVLAQTTAIVGGKVHTVGPLGTIDNATIIIENGRIRSVGTSLSIPSGARVIDASGKIITPGLFAPTGQMGLVEVGLSAGPIDSQQRGEQYTASFDVADAYNRRSTLIPINRIEGVTRAAIVPSPAQPNDRGEAGHILSGLAAIVNLGDNNVLDRRGAAMVVTLGERGSNFSGGTRTGAWLILRNALDEAADYRDNKVDVARGMRREYQHSISDLEALQSVIDGDMPLLVGVDRASDIETLIRLSREVGFKAIIVGGTEAWMVADAVAAANIPVILAPLANLPGNFDRINARSGAATLLIKAGVKVAFTEARSETHNARNMTQTAGNAVGDGLAWDAALRAITLTPAEIYGVADTVGSIEAGKAADIVIWPADPLEVTSYPDQVLINGVDMPMVSRQTLLRDRYLQSGAGKPPVYRD